MKRILLSTIFFIFILTALASLPSGSLNLQERAGTIDPNQKELKIYPNPAESGRVTLELNSGEIYEIRLINIAGKEVVYRKLDFGTQKYSLALDNLPNGIYFVRVQSTENKTIVKKLIVSSH